jgi:RNA polymerase sigma factor (sigma-70 family)
MGMFAESSLADADLVAQTREGSTAAFAELVRRYWAQGNRVAQTLVKDASEAEDMVQESFLRAFRNLDLLVDPGKFGPWYRRIVFGVCVDWLRTFRPDMYRSYGEEDPLSQCIDPTPSALQRLEEQEIILRVQLAVKSLPDRYRLPLTLYHLNGLSQTKIADALGVPASTVRSLVTRARQKLEPLLRDVFEEQKGMVKLLHITNGDSVVGTLREASVPGNYSPWADVLWEGPVQHTGEDDAFLSDRARFLRKSGYSNTYDESLSKLQIWETALNSYRSYDEVVLWFEHDLFDQLILIRLLDWFARRELGHTRLSLICIGEYPGVPGFRGLGELQADQLGPLLDTRLDVLPPQIQLGHAAWRAFTGSDPVSMEKLLAAGTTPLPFLAGAFERLLEEFPSTHNGLARSEQQALTAVAESGSTTAGRMFLAIQNMEERSFMGDTSFWRILTRLAAEPHPLLHISGRTEESFSKRTVDITELGRQVLAGNEDYVRLRGIDKWIGGVHLHGAESRWRWSGSNLVTLPI